MFREFYNEILVQLTQLTNAELHQFIKVSLLNIGGLFVPIMCAYIWIFEEKKLVKGIIISLLFSVFIYFNIFWGLCFPDNIWKQCFWLIPTTLFGMIYAGFKFYIRKKRGIKQNDNI